MRVFCCSTDKIRLIKSRFFEELGTCVGLIRCSRPQMKIRTDKRPSANGRDVIRITWTHTKRQVNHSLPANAVGNRNDALSASKQNPKQSVILCWYV